MRIDLYASIYGTLNFSSWSSTGLAVRLARVRSRSKRTVGKSGPSCAAAIAVTTVATVAILIHMVHQFDGP